jgi:hypothetical protein
MQLDSKHISGFLKSRQGCAKRSQSDRMNGVKKAIIQGATHPFAWHTFLSLALFSAFRYFSEAGYLPQE